MGTNQYSLFCVCNCRRTFHNAGELNNRDNSEYGWTLDDHVWVKIACLLRNPNNRAEIEAKPSSIQANSKDGKCERKEMGEYHFLCALVASLVCKPQIFHIYSTHADEMSKPQSDAGFTFWPNAIDANVYCFFLVLFGKHVDNLSWHIDHRPMIPQTCIREMIYALQKV